MSWKSYLSVYGQRLVTSLQVGIIGCVFGFGLGCLMNADAAPPVPEIQVWFSPKGGCTEALVKGIDAAKKSVHFSAYEFTSDPIRNALIRALGRGVTVECVVDRRAHLSRHEDADEVQENGGRIFVDGKHNIHHNKIIVIDSRVVFTGSFNFSDNAENRNAENVLRLEDSALAKKYVANFDVHKHHSEGK